MIPMQEFDSAAELTTEHTSHGRLLCSDACHSAMQLGGGHKASDGAFLAAICPSCCGGTAYQAYHCQHEKPMYGLQRRILYGRLFWGTQDGLPGASLRWPRSIAHLCSEDRREMNSTPVFEHVSNSHLVRKLQHVIVVHGNLMARCLHPPTLQIL